MHLLNDCVKNDVHGGVVSPLIGATEVLIHGLKPADVIVSVRDHVDVELLVLVASLVDVDILLVYLLLVGHLLLVLPHQEVIERPTCLGQRIEPPKVLWSYLSSQRPDHALQGQKDDQFHYNN